MSIRFFSLLLLVSFTISSVLSCDNDEECLHNDHHKANLSMSEVDSSEGNQTTKLHVNETELQQSYPRNSNTGLEPGIIFVIVFFVFLFASCSACLICNCCRKASSETRHGYIVPNTNSRATGVQTQQPVINQYQEQAISAHHFQPYQAQQLPSAYTQESSHQFPTKRTQEYADQFPSQYAQPPFQQFPPHPAQPPFQQFPPHPAQPPVQPFSPYPAQHPSQFSPNHPQGQYSPTGQQHYNQEDLPPTYDDSQALLKY